MELLPATPMPAYALPTLPVGAMMVKDGTSATLPWPLPPMTTTYGTAWVITSTPTVLRIRERDINWRHVPVTFDQTMSITRPGRMEYTVRGTFFGLPTPVFSRSYDILDAGRGWISLRGVGHPEEAPSSIRVDVTQFTTDFEAPMHEHDRKTLPITVPGAPGYVAPPPNW